MTSFSKAYKDAGVDIRAGYRAVELMKEHIAKTVTKGVISDIGGFGGLFELPEGYKKPVLVAGTDGVGTKLKLAFKLKKFDTVGIDCVAMCVNDIICSGANPLCFLDYIACGRNNPEEIAELVKGISVGCIEAGAAVIGGETAEMPEFYTPGEYDLAGFCIGIVEKSRILNKNNMREGDSIIALHSSGVHSNGFSLIRKVFGMDNLSKEELLNPVEELSGRSLGEELLTPTRIYVQPVLSLISEINVSAISHITGGGFYENIPRALPEGKTAVINTKQIQTQPIFKLLQSRGGIDNKDMYNTFNMGVGMVIVVPNSDADKAVNILNSYGDIAYRLGEIVDSKEGIILE